MGEILEQDIKGPSLKRSRLTASPLTSLLMSSTLIFADARSQN